METGWQTVGTDTYYFRRVAALQLWALHKLTAAATTSAHLVRWNTG